MESFTYDLEQTYWQEWLKRWDKMQKGYLPWREHAYNLMFKALAYWMPEKFVALDIACGPGAISSRLLAHFPQAHCIGIDFDPILLAIGRQTLGDGGGRMTWIEADLRDPAWLGHLSVETVDAVVSSTALHWLASDELMGLYARLGRLVRLGGILLNADEMRPASPRLWPFFHDWSRRAWQDSFASADTEDWEQFWKAIAREPAFRSLYALRQERIATVRCSSDMWGATLPLHSKMLRTAGFEAVDTLWQEGIERVIIALR